MTPAGVSYDSFGPGYVHELYAISFSQNHSVQAPRLSLGAVSPT